MNFTIVFKSFLIKVAVFVSVLCFIIAEILISNTVSNNVYHSAQDYENYRFLQNLTKNTPIDLKKDAIKQPKRVVSRHIVCKPMVVIIIDDVGTDMTHFTSLMELNYPLTISILPGEKHSVLCSEIAHQKGFEVMLHQPMQPKNNEAIYFGYGEIKVNMKPQFILEILKENIKSIPYVKGINNHMGSLATTKAEMMRTVMRELKAQKLYFVDSLTSGSSIAFKIAKEEKVPSLTRDIFIDTNNGYQYALTQLKMMQRLAKKKGIAVAIGHCRKDTINALKKSLPEIQKSGIDIIRVSEALE